MVLRLIKKKLMTRLQANISGKTNTYRLKGDLVIQVQVYNKGGSKPDQLNMYKEEVCHRRNEVSACNPRCKD